MKYEILNESGEVINTILADAVFVEQYHPGAYRLVQDASVDAAKAAEVRQERDAKLAATDWVQGSDVPQATKDKWAPYRQALRDVPQQAGFPWEVQWPDAP